MAVVVFMSQRSKHVGKSGEMCTVTRVIISLNCSDRFLLALHLQHCLKFRGLAVWVGVTLSLRLSVCSHFFLEEPFCSVIWTQSSLFFPSSVGFGYYLFMMSVHSLFFVSIFNLQIISADTFDMLWFNTFVLWCWWNALRKIFTLIPCCSLDFSPQTTPRRHTLLFALTVYLRISLVPIITSESLLTVPFRSWNHENSRAFHLHLSLD